MPADNQKRNHLNMLSLLASMPFHHLLSAKEIYSSIAAKYPKLNMPNLLKTPNERLRSFREAAAGQTDPSAMPVVLDRYIQANFSENISFDDDSSRSDSAEFSLDKNKKHDSENKSEIEWQVIFRDELQGCGEIYRAEMLIFKRLLYEQNKELQSPFKMTNENFPNHLDYKLFDVLTNDQTEMLLINSLAANYKLSVSIPGESAKTGNGRMRYLPIEKNIKKADRQTEQNATLLTDRIRGWESYYADEDIDPNSLNNHNELRLIIYNLKLGSYWHGWREAARLAKFDFDLLETIDDPRAIRFYELTKLLRLSSYDKKVQNLPNKLEIDYEKFVSLMPLPKFRTKDEIEQQISDLTKPLKTAGYIKSFSNEEKHILVFRFL